MPAPPILSAQMEPPPIAPIIEIDLVGGLYQVNEEDVVGGVDVLLRNASGFDQPSLLRVANKGIPLHWDSSQWASSIWPPSIVATPYMISLVQALVDAGGFTAVYEFENEVIYNDANDAPNMYIFAEPPFSGVATFDKTIEWHNLEVFVSPPGYMFEGYAHGHPTTSMGGYTGGSPTAASGGRRHRVAGTWCWDRGTGVGVQRWQSGQSVDGTPQYVNVSFGHTPYNTDYNLSYFGPIDSIHFGSVGIDIDYDPLGDNGWWWWPPPGYWLRYIAFYRARPVSALPILSKQEHQILRVTQVYAEVIHDPVIITVHPPTAIITLVPEIPDIPNVGPQAAEIVLTAIPPTLVG